MCKLDKTIYDLEQTPRAYPSSFSRILEQLGFTPSKEDTSSFVYQKFGITIYMLIFIDDFGVNSLEN